MAASAPNPEEILYNTIGQLYQANLNWAAALAWVSYDILITLDEEVMRMWRTKLSVPSFIYFSTRYVGFIYLIWSVSVSTNYKLTVEVCKPWGPIEAAVVQFLSTAVNALLALRIDAFYNRGGKVRYFLIFIFIADTAIEITLSTLSGTNAASASVHPPGIPIPGCLGGLADAPRLALISWVTNIVYQVLCFGLALYKFFSAFGASGISRSHLASMFMRDGALIFFMIFWSHIVAIVLNYGIPQNPLVEICIPWLVASVTLGAPRIIINLQNAAHPHSYTSEFEMHIRSLSLAFAPGPVQTSNILPAETSGYKPSQH
ncbi:hypothetical protein C8J56DRAFT_1166556 [Mycena floridula]|nr:hypothetical protein C8J56DRAFT_1166556 [Mycena floridula]